MSTGRAAAPLSPTSTSCHRALRIPEIVDLILEQLASDTTAIFGAAQVCRLWARKCLSLLWHRPPPEALLRIRDDARRPLYAKWIGAVVADNLNDYADELALWAPHLRLEQLSVPAHVHDLAGTVYPRLFQPRLTCLRCSAAAFVAESTLDLIVALSPRLAEVVLEGEADVFMDPELFLRIIRQLHGLKCLDFVDPTSLAVPTDFLFSKAAFLHLSQAPSLMRVTATGTLSVDCFAYVLKHNASPFPNLRSLGVTVDSEAIPLMTRTFLRLTASLRLHLLDARQRIFPHLAAWLPHLHHLCLTLPTRYEMTPEDVEVLRRLPQLRTLRLSAEQKPLLVTWFMDSHLVGLLRSLPHLVRFDFDVMQSLSTYALVLVGQSAPQMETLYLPGLCDLRTLDAAPAILFPCLQSLRLTTIVQHRHL
jgi:hypothetical protein